MTALGAARAGSPALAALRSTRIKPYRAAAIAAVAVGADRAVDPTSTHVPLCPLHALTGIWCPFCGGLRSAYELTRLHFSAAVHYNVMFVLALPVLAALWVDWAGRAHRGQPRRVMPRSVTLAVVIALVAFTVLRNLPFAAAWRGGT